MSFAREAGWLVQSNWTNAGKAMQAALQKQGGQLLPEIQNLSEILQTK